MIKITNIRKQVVESDNQKLKAIFLSAIEEKENDDIRIFGTAERDWHDSDLEDLQDILYKHGVSCSITEIENYFNSYNTEEEN